jgi:hypothetical protein
MKYYFLLLVATTFYTAGFSQDNPQLHQFMRDSFDVIKSRVEKSVIKARYMEGKLINETDSLNGWEGFKVKLYEYSVFDNASHATLKARVYLLDANSAQIAKWVISTCWAVKENLQKKYTDFQIQSIRDASGGQFPVGGVVYEDMDGAGQKPYLFKDGVTVFLNNINITALNESQIFELANVKIQDIKRTGKFARIISTTREQYSANGGTQNTDGLNWLTVVREEYKKAWNTDKNNLMIAWAKQNLNF